MKLILRWLAISTFTGMVFVLTGCTQVNTARQWWHVWRNPISNSSPTTSSPPRKVEINLLEIAQHHPAWKLAQQLESSPPTGLKLQWTKPGNLAETNLVSTKSTFTANNPEINFADFSEPEQMLTASGMETLNAQIAQEQQAAWDKWKKNIQGNLQEDRDQIARAMHVDLNDQIDQTQKNIPEIGSPLVPSADIQIEMINLRLKLLNNIALTPAEKETTQKRLDQLNAQWTAQLRQQAQQGADRQKYWRETVPRQMREKGESNIAQTLQTLQQQDQKIIDLTINSQQQSLEQDNAQNSIYSLTLSDVIAKTIRTKSTFHAPALSVKSIQSSFSSISTPTIANLQPVSASQTDVRQLKQVAMDAAKRAAAQSVTRHHWQWVAARAKTKPALPDVTDIILRESNFR